MSLLAVANLSKSFGAVRAVSDVSFSLEAGELLAMIGPNGAGKTTCFNLLNGQLRPDQGKVVLEGRSIQGSAPRVLARLGVGRTFQVAATFGSMTVRENVQVALLSHAGKLGSTRLLLKNLLIREANDILATVGLSDQENRPCSLLAYGDLKRVELAIALAGRPRLLLMDEPTAGMAASERRVLMNLVEEISAKNNIGVLFTEHDMDVVFAHADRVMVLSEGELIAEGTPAQVRANARVREVYLGGEGAGA